jgi:RNase P/RNase MRP subunit POP5
MGPRGGPRKRYVAFIVEAEPTSTPPSRAAMVAALDAACASAGLPEGRRLTTFDGRCGIVRCTNSDRDAVLGALRGIASVGGAPTRVVPVVTSGTIKKAKSHLVPAAASEPRG